MNSVHLVTQEKYQVEPGPKTESECTKPQPGPAGPACAHRPRARGCVVGGLAVWWSSPLAMSQRKAAVSQLSQRAHARPRIRSSAALRAPRTPAAAPRVPAATCPACRALRLLLLRARAARQRPLLAQPLAQPLTQRAHVRACCAQRRVAALCYDTVQQPTVPAITIQFLYCDTNFFSQPAFLPQYKTLYCNTISCSPVSCNTNPAIQS